MNNSPIDCIICSNNFTNKRSFATHLQTTHKLKSIDYTIEYLYNNTQPTCAICNKETRYVSFSFKRFCKVHSKNAERLGGKKGGKAQAWNKGLTKNIDTRLAKQAKSMLGEKNHFYKKQHTQESINKIKIAKLISRSEFAKRILLRSTDFELLTTYEDYFSRQQQYLQLKCKKCNTIQEKTLQAFERGSICYVCFPNNTSNEERELRAFIEHITDETLIYNSRKIISPKELDIYIPSKNIAIEYNGLYWHSRDDKDKNDHKLKTLLCRDKDIKLIHIFSDEWKYKRNICKSIIKHKIGITKNRIFARKCVIKEVNSSSASKFFNDSHISGYSPSKIIFGLFYESKLVSALSLRKPRHNAYVHSIEICRFASQLNTSVIGGFSKLLKHVIRWCYNNNINKIITYADLRFNNGDVYKKNSFTFIKDTGLDYWYTDGVHRYNRFKFRAQNGVSEKEVALKAKVTRIYGCGNNLYEMKLT